jgi:hypothetical protein
MLPEGNPAAMGNLRREAQARGVLAERLVFAPYLSSPADHLARLHLAMRGKGMGLGIMSYRAELIGAIFNISRGKSGGTMECIGCRFCYSACDVVAWDEVYLGPAALNRA